jgi:hypothetical protein
MVLGDNGLAYANDGATITAFSLNGMTALWAYQAPANSVGMNIIAASEGGGLVAKTTDQNGNDTVIRLDSNGAATVDAWSVAGYSLVDFLAGDTFEATSLASGLITMIASGQDVEWALYSPWADPQPDNRADPKVKLTLSVSNVYKSEPEDIQSNSHVTTVVNNATAFWWEKAKISLQWDGTITPVKACDPVAYPNGCSGTPQLDISEITSAVAANEFVGRFCTAGQTPKCTQKGVQLVFNQDIGTALGYTPFTGPTNAAIFMNISAVSASALEDNSADDSSNHDVSHELGHQFQLHHIGWSLPSNLMCTGILPSWENLNQFNLCPTHAGGRLDGDQIEDVLQGATRYQ